MPFEDRQRKFGHEMVEITSPEQARDLMKNKSIRSRTSVEERDWLARKADQIQKDWDDGRV